MNDLFTLMWGNCKWNAFFNWWHSSGLRSLWEKSRCECAFNEIGSLGIDIHVTAILFILDLFYIQFQRECGEIVWETTRNMFQFHMSSRKKYSKVPGLLHTRVDAFTVMTLPSSLPNNRTGLAVGQFGEGKVVAPSWRLHFHSPRTHRQSHLPQVCRNWDDYFLLPPAAIWQFSFSFSCGHRFEFQE